MAFETRREGKVRRLPEIAQKGSLVGVVSMDDILLRTEPRSLGKQLELSSDGVVRAYRAINQRHRSLQSMLAQHDRGHAEP